MNTRKPAKFSTRDLFQDLRGAAPVAIPAWTAVELSVDAAVGNFRQLDWKGKLGRAGGASLNAAGGMLFMYSALSLFQMAVNGGADAKNTLTSSPSPSKR